MDRSRYRVFTLKQANGKKRKISAPDKELKKIQKGILAYLQDWGVKESPFAHGGVKWRSIKTNALQHAGKAYVLRLDIKDFFPSVRVIEVQKALMREGLPRYRAEEIANIVTIDGVLPQGSPTSPFIANIVAKQIDKRIFGLIRSYEEHLLKKARTRYTRYFDDITLSSNENDCLPLYLPPIKTILSSEGYEINWKKTKYWQPGGRKCVTGVIVNNSPPGVSRRRRRSFRACLHNIKRALIRGEPVEYDVAALRGYFAYIKGVNEDQAKSFEKNLHIIEEFTKERAHAESHS